jgi:hypothetical protein
VLFRSSFLKATNGVSFALVGNWLLEMQRKGEHPTQNYGWFLFMAEKTWHPPRLTKAVASIPEIS